MLLLLLLHSLYVLRCEYRYTEVPLMYIRSLVIVSNFLTPAMASQLGNHTWV